MKINWGAILLAAIVHFGFGAVWFTAFSKPWQAGTRMSPEEIQAYTAHPNFWPFIISFLCSFGMALVISWVLGMSCKFSLFRGIVAGLMVGIVAALAMITEMAFEYRSSQLHVHLRRLPADRLHPDGHRDRRLEAERRSAEA